MLTRRFLPFLSACDGGGRRGVRRSCWLPDMCKDFSPGKRPSRCRCRCRCRRDVPDQPVALYAICKDGALLPPSPTTMKTLPYRPMSCGRRRQRKSKTAFAPLSSASDDLPLPRIFTSHHLRRPSFHQSSSIRGTHNPDDDQHQLRWPTLEDSPTCLSLGPPIAPSLKQAMPLPSTERAAARPSALLKHMPSCCYLSPTKSIPSSSAALTMNPLTLASGAKSIATLPLPSFLSTSAPAFSNSTAVSPCPSAIA